MNVLFNLAVSLCMITTLQNGCKSMEKATDPYVVEVRSTGYMGGDDYYRAYYAGDLRMYESHYFGDSSVGIFDTLKNKIDIVKTTKYIGTQYFLFHKDSAYGYRYQEPISIQEKPTRLRVDSMLKIITLQPGILDSTLYWVPDTVEWNTDRSALREVYLVKANNGNPGYSRSMYYSRKLNYVGESFSKKIDSARNMKLYKVEGVMNEFYDSTNNRVWPAIRAANEMLVVPMSDSANVARYLNAYRRIVTERNKN